MQNNSNTEIWCDKHSDSKVHKPMYASKDRRTGKLNGSYFCPNVESVDEAGKRIYCKFMVAPSYNPLKGYVSPNDGFTDSPGDAELIN